MNVILEEWLEIFSEISRGQHTLFRVEEHARRAKSWPNPLNWAVCVSHFTAFTWWKIPRMVKWLQTPITSNTSRQR